MSRIVAVVLAGMPLTVGACGKKAPPFWPQERMDARVVDLRAERVGRGILLRGTIGGLEGLDSAKRPAGARIYYARYPIEAPPCDGCPIEYRGYQDVGPEALNEDGFRGELQVRTDPQIYFLKVHLMGKEGVFGPASDRVKVVVE